MYICKKKKPIMKRLFTFILLIVCLLAVSVECFAQYPYSHVEAEPGIVSPAIVRYYPGNRGDRNNICYDYLVVYYEESNVGHVALVDVVGGIKRDVSLDPRIKLNDMRIAGDTLYMGGRENYSSGQNDAVGCIAWMKMSDFLSGTATVVYYEPCLWLRGVVKRMAAYKCIESSTGNLTRKIFTVGDIFYQCDSSDLFPNSNCHNNYYIDTLSMATCSVNVVMEIADPHLPPLMGSLPQRPRIITPVTTESQDEETIHDVVVTENNVAFVGVMKGTMEDYVVLHTSKKNKSFLDDTVPGSIRSQSRFSNYLKFSLRDYSNGQYRACGLYGEYVAIAAGNESSPRTGITLRIFDLSTRQMIKSYRVADGEDVEFYDMAYDRVSNKLMLLFYMGTKLYLCPVDPFSSINLQMVQCLVKNRDSILYTSLDAMHSDYFSAVGGRRGLVSRIMSWTHDTECYQLVQVEVKEIDLLARLKYNFDYDNLDFVPINWMTTPEPQQSVVHVNCIKQ